MRKQTSRSLGVLYAFIAFSFPATGFSNPMSGATEPYSVGYVAYNVPLKYFVPVSLKNATQLLSAGNLSAAKPVFEQEVNRNPKDFAAVVGFLQSCPEDWPDLLPKYEASAKADPSAANEFRLGVLKYYFGFSGSIRTQEKWSAGNQAGPALRLAYDLSHDPVVGFVCCDSCCDLNEDPMLIAEDMLQRVGGPVCRQEYATAQSKSWAGPLPEVPKLDSKTLFITSRVVGFLYSFHGVQAAAIAGGSSPPTYEPLTVQQQAATGFLLRWRDELKAASGLSYSAI